MAFANRMSALTEQLAKRLREGGSIERKDLSTQLLNLSKFIDHAVASNQKPVNPNVVIKCFKQFTFFKYDEMLRPSVMVLMLSIKSACLAGWFSNSEVEELLQSYKFLSEHFLLDGECTKPSSAVVGGPAGGPISAEVSDAASFIEMVCSKFYPRFFVVSVLVALTTKPGYEVHGVDFQVTSQLANSHKLRLFVCDKDKLGTAACLATPPLLSFLVNGKPVDKRIYHPNQDKGPQLPTEITTMLRIGCNFLQVIGECTANYFIAVAIMGSVAWSSANALKTALLADYVSPSTTPENDDEVQMFGRTKVSLRCPISLKRIVTPVKGVSCRHHQAFDYDSYIEINARRPSWRCPCCNNYVNCPELRLDRQMEKILKEVGETIFDVMVNYEGTLVSEASADETDVAHTQRVGESLIDVLPDENVILISDNEEEDHELENMVSDSEPNPAQAFRSSTSSVPFVDVVDIKPDIRTMVFSQPVASTLMHVPPPTNVYVSHAGAVYSTIPHVGSAPTTASSTWGVQASQGGYIHSPAPTNVSISNAGALYSTIPHVGPATTTAGSTWGVQASQGGHMHSSAPSDVSLSHAGAVYSTLSHLGPGMTIWGVQASQGVHTHGSAPSDISLSHAGPVYNTLSHLGPATATASDSWGVQASQGGYMNLTQSAVRNPSSWVPATGLRSSSGQYSDGRPATMERQLYPQATRSTVIQALPAQSHYSSSSGGRTILTGQVSCAPSIPSPTAQPLHANLSDRGRVTLSAQVDSSTVVSGGHSASQTPSHLPATLAHEVQTLQQQLLSAQSSRTTQDLQQDVLQEMRRRQEQQQYMHLQQQQQLQQQLQQEYMQIQQHQQQQQQQQQHRQQQQQYQLRQQQLLQQYQQQQAYNQIATSRMQLNLDHAQRNQGHGQRGSQQHRSMQHVQGPVRDARAHHSAATSSYLQMQSPSSSTVQNAAPTQDHWLRQRLNESLQHAQQNVNSRGSAAGYPVANGGSLPPAHGNATGGSQQVLPNQFATNVHSGRTNSVANSPAAGTNNTYPGVEGWVPPAHLTNWRPAGTPRMRGAIATVPTAGVSAGARGGGVTGMTQPNAVNHVRATPNPVSLVPTTPAQTGITEPGVLLWGGRVPLVTGGAGQVHIAPQTQAANTILEDISWPSQLPTIADTTFMDVLESNQPGFWLDDTLFNPMSPPGQ